MLLTRTHFGIYIRKLKSFKLQHDINAFKESQLLQCLYRAGDSAIV